MTNIKILKDKSQFQIIPILPNKSQFQNPKQIWIWDLGFILDLVVFGFWIYHLDSTDALYNLFPEIHYPYIQYPTANFHLWNLILRIRING